MATVGTSLPSLSIADKVPCRHTLRVTTTASNRPPLSLSLSHSSRSNSRNAGEGGGGGRVSELSPPSERPSHPSPPREPSIMPHDDMSDGQAHFRTEAGASGNTCTVGQCAGNAKVHSDSQIANSSRSHLVFQSVHRPERQPGHIRGGEGGPGQVPVLRQEPGRHQGHQAGQAQDSR